MMRNNVLIAAAAAAALGGSAWAQSSTVSGTGSAPITRDTGSVAAIAEENAKADAALAMGRQILGAERISELSPDIVRHLSTQIRSEMIVHRSAERLGKEYRVTLDVRVDPAWFQGLLDNEGVITSSHRAGGQTQRIFVMLDENDGPARDYQQPTEIVTDYDHSKGASFSDKSAAAYSERDRAGSSLHDRSASSAQASTAAGYSDGYGSAAGLARARAASASSFSAASASSHSEAAVAKNNIQASEHDDTSFHQRVTYQTSSKTGPAEVARPALGSALERYDVSLAVSDLELASYFKGNSPTYSALRQSADFQPFLVSLSRRNVAPFFMGGTFTVRDGPRDSATGQATCTGSLSSIAFSTSDSASIGQSGVNATGVGASYEDCAASLSRVLAQQAADDLGPKIQKYWRNQSRDQSRLVSAVSTGPLDYTLVVRAAQLDMAMQADLLDALSATPGVQSQVFLGQSGGQMSFQVRYGGSVPLQLALFQKLRGNPAFAHMQPTVDGRSVILCLSGC